METVSGFCDLCINGSAKQQTILEICKKLISLGYKAVAINQIFDDSLIENKKKKKKSDVKEIQTDIIPAPINLDFLKEIRQKLKIFHRLTIKFSDNSLITKLNQSSNIRKYDIIASLPITQTTFQITCSNFDVDIVTFDSESKNIHKLSRKLYNQAVNRGLFFELMYTPAILDSTNRKNIIHMSHLYHGYGKSRHIIISSWASDPIHVRGPYDVMNLGLIFGLSEQQAKSAITTECRDVIVKANGRKYGKTIFLIESKDSVDESNEEKMEIEPEDNQPASKKLKQSNVQ